YGFAVIAPDGEVLFHSTDGLSLEENFFEEVSNAQGVRERMQADRVVAWSGDYHGTPHRILVRPLEALQGAGGKGVAFQDLSPALAAIVEHQSGTLRVSLVNIIALLLITPLAVWWYMKLRGRDLRDLMTAPVSPKPALLWGLVVLMALAVAAVVTTGRPWAY